MYSPATFRRPVHLSPATKFQNPKQTLITKSPHHFINSSSYSTKSTKRIQFQNQLYKIHTSSRLLKTPRVSSDDAVSFDEFEVSEPSFLEFITSERVKVVAMVGLALALCNADRVVMSVAIVPLSQSRGWSQSFAGVVQVPVFVSILYNFYLSST